MTDPPARSDWRTWLYAAVALVVGAAIMSLEMVASRFLAPVFGGSILTWATLIAVVMVALAAGYLVGGRLADRFPDPRLAGLLIAAAALYLLGVARWGASLLPGLRLGDDLRLGCLLGALALTFVPSALLATWAPYALRLTVRAAGHTGRASGRLYGISTLGSVFGTLSTAFVLVPAVGSARIAWALSAFVLLAAVGLFAAAWVERRAQAGAASGMVLPAVVVALFAALYPMVRPSAPEPSPVTSSSPSAAAPDTVGVLATRESPYSDIYVVREGDYLSLRFARDMRFWDESRINADDPGELPLPYNRLMLVGLAYPEAPRRLLMLGLGGGSLTRFLGALMPDLAITAVELDTVVIELARRYFGLAEASGFEVLCDDARLYLQRMDAPFDVIMADTYRGGTVPFHMVSREFFQLARSRLAPGGCLVVNLHSGSRLFDGVVKTLRAVFDRVDTYQSPEAGNVIAVAADQDAPAAQQLGARATALQARYRFPYHLRTLLGYRIDVAPDSGTEVLVDDFAPTAYLAAVERHNQRLSPTYDERHRPTAQAVALRDLRIDGDLSDWPRQVVEFPVVTNGHAYGETDIDGADLTTSPDLSPRFMVAWDPGPDLLYVALRVRDDALVNTGADPWSSDACELYAAADPAASLYPGDVRQATAGDLGVQQYVAVPGPGSYGSGWGNPGLSRGDIAATSSRAAYTRRGDVTIYEWAVQVFEHYPDRPLQLQPGQTLGFDVVVVDKDGADDQPAWICWGPALPRKYANPSALGRLHLASPD